MASGCWRYEAIVILADAWNTLKASCLDSAAAILYHMLEDEYAIGADCSVTKSQPCYCETHRRRMGSPVILNINGNSVREIVEISREMR